MTTSRTAALEALATQTIELPSWAFGNSGTRFKVFGQPVPPDLQGETDARHGSSGGARLLAREGQG